MSDSSELGDITATLAQLQDKALIFRLRRDELIRALHRDGLSLREIGGIAGMSAQGVKDVIRRQSSGR